MWYNSTTKTLKGFTSNPAGTWATITALNTARGAGQLGGTATSAWFVGGETNPPPGTPSNWSVKNELWNGTSWTESNDLTRPGFYSGMGSRGVPNNTTGLVFGGHQGGDPGGRATGRAGPPGHQDQRARARPAADRRAATARWPPRPAKAARCARSAV